MQVTVVQDRRFANFSHLFDRLPEEAETCSLGVGYKQIVPSGGDLLELVIPIFIVELLHQRVRLCQDNEATCPDSIIAMASISVDAYSL
ncbi:hypothetical protein PMIN01_10722 [Paraphaeosphaeria minitans]|uniref:Uncharacterized protein n=1 Tax=Paraphaeosphaeria minitans TaxID=565426 RepID=A0A9P6GC83_9PLEO|nr:hypothetical protein PMIN01_10722 [Paraphaeosphaeria minitans]